MSETLNKAGKVTKIKTSAAVKVPKETKDSNEGAHKHGKACSMRFEPGDIKDFLSVLDAVAWINCPDKKQVSQFAGLEAKVTTAMLANGILLGLLDSFDGELYSLVPPYPFKGTLTQKRSVVHESLIRLPLLINVRQFMSMDETLDDALRKAATVQRVENFDPEALAPLVAWAKDLKALEPRVVLEDLYEAAAVEKKERNEKHPKKRVVMLSHSPKDSAIVRQIATDLTAESVTVWLHEQRIRSVERIPEKIDQGLVESDFLLLGISENSINSPWMKNEMNVLLLDEVARRGTRLLPLKFTDCLIPELVISKPFIDFTISYKTGLQQLLQILRGDLFPAVESEVEVVSGGVLPPGTIVTER